MFNKKFLILTFITVSFNFLLPKIPYAEASCSLCNTAIDFACMSTTQYAKCNATAIDLRTIAVCPSPTICNETIPLNTPLSSIPCYFNQASVAYNAVDISCNRALQTYVINSASSAPTVFCASRNQGLYIHPTKTCAYYIRCFIDSSGILTGAEYHCPGSTRFNLAAQNCDTSVTC